MPLIDEKLPSETLCGDFILNTKVNRQTSGFDFFRRMDVYLSSPEMIQASHKAFKSYPGAKQAALPLDVPQVSMSLEDAILDRTSRREFGEAEISREKMTALLRAAAGLKENGAWVREAGDHWPHRATASAGALYPLEVYLLNLGGIEGLDSDFFHFNVRGFYLEQLGIKPARETLNLILPELAFQKNAKAVIIVTAVFERTLVKYGRRGMRFVLGEVGHLQAHLGLAAAALKIGLYHYGGGFDQEIEAILKLDGLAEPLVGVSILG